MVSEESLTNVDREAMKIVGVNIGALTVKVVALQGKDKRPAVMAHQGRPLAVLEKLLAEKDFAGADYFGVSPDIITTAKGVTNGTIPMGAVFVKSKIREAFMQGPEEVIDFFHGYTYSGHPVSCAACIATSPGVM